MQIIEDNRELREKLGSEYKPPPDLLMKQKAREQKMKEEGEKSIEFVEESMGNEFNEDDPISGD